MRNILKIKITTAPPRVGSLRREKGGKGEWEKGGEGANVRSMTA
jgi:hypothetical protein